MKWDDLHIVLAVSRSRTMTEAAARLGVDQTTISRRLRLLEESLGTSLVTRRRDGFDMTEVGESVALSGEAVETIVHDLERQLLGVDTTLAGRLRVTTMDVMTQYHADLFTSFAQRYPTVELEIEATSNRRALTRREADVAIRWIEEPDEGLFGRKLARAEFALYASEELHRSVGSSDLSKYPWLAFTAASKALLTEQFMKEHVPQATIVCRYEDSMSLHAAIRGGAGVGFIPCAFADPDPGLVRLRDVEPDFGYDIWCLTHPDLSTTRRVRSFIAHAAEYFGARKDLFAGRARPLSEET